MAVARGHMQASNLEESLGDQSQSAVPRIRPFPVLEKTPAVVRNLHLHMFSPRPPKPCPFLFPRNLFSLSSTTQSPNPIHQQFPQRALFLCIIITKLQLCPNIPVTSYRTRSATKSSCCPPLYCLLPCWPALPLPRTAHQVSILTLLIRLPGVRYLYALEV